MYSSAWHSCRKREKYRRAPVKQSSFSFSAASHPQGSFPSPGPRQTPSATPPRHRRLPLSQEARAVKSQGSVPMELNRWAFNQPKGRSEPTPGNPSGSLRRLPLPASLAARLKSGESWLFPTQPSPDGFLLLPRGGQCKEGFLAARKEGGRSKRPT